MKVRTSFVSNSSSSSFVLVAIKSAHEIAFDLLSKKYQDILKDCFTSAQYLGKDVVTSAIVGDHGGLYLSGCDEDGCFEAYEKYQDALGLDPDEVFIHEEHW